MLPQARHDKLLLQHLADELIVYDEERDRAHCLNRAAALVWQHCDGYHTVADLAAVLAEESDLPTDEHLVWLTLEHLQQAHLLHHPLLRPADRAGLSRRELLQRLGRTAAVALLVPMVTSISAPIPAMAQNIGGGGGGDGGTVDHFMLCCVCSNKVCTPLEGTRAQIRSECSSFCEGLGTPGVESRGTCGDPDRCTATVID